MTNISIALAALNDGQVLKINPQGTSMCPFFYGGRDCVYVAVPQFPLKRGDIALFLRTDNTYVIHRVYKVKTKQGTREYYMMGDNQNFIEGPIDESQIHAVAKSIVRKGKIIDCKKNMLYRFCSKLWLILKPLRPLFISAWNHSHIKKRRASSNEAKNQKSSG